VLATVKDAARRLQRWPKRAILDRGCARRHWAKAGRDGKTALGSNRKTDQKEAAENGPAAVSEALTIAPGRLHREHTSGLPARAKHIL
jgi:hypothetical protein